MEKSGVTKTNYFMKGEYSYFAIKFSQITNYPRVFRNMNMWAKILLTFNNLTAAYLSALEV